MKKNKGLFLKILLNRISSTEKGGITPAYLRALPKDAADAYFATTIDAVDPTPLMGQKTAMLAKWHYSWIHLLLEPLDIVKRKALMALLDKSQQEGIAKLISIPIQVHPPLIIEFYKSQIYPLLDLGSSLPIEYLPKSPFNRLLNMEKENLLKIIDLLGMYDLAHEIKRIVAKKTLKDIYACLSADEQVFLRQCLHAKDYVMTPNLHLENWNGEKKELMRILHRRGISRLALALSGQSPDLIWHLTHIFDTGRGQLLQKSIQNTKIPSLTDAVGLQVENAINTLLKKNSQ